VLVAEVAFTDAERRLGAHPTVGALVVRILLRHPVVRLRLRFERRRRLLAVTERVPLAVGPLQSELDRELVARFGVVGERAPVARVYREVEPTGRPIALAAFERLSLREIERDVLRVGICEVELRPRSFRPGFVCRIRSETPSSASRRSERTR